MATIIVAVIAHFRSLPPLPLRIMESPVGWLLPGGAAYKLGRQSAKHGKKTWHNLPFLAGLLDGWNNVGRERARRKQGLDDQ